MKEYRKAKTSKIISAIVNDQQRRACETLPFGMKFSDTLRSSQCISGLDFDQSSVIGGHISSHSSTLFDTKESSTNLKTPEICEIKKKNLENEIFCQKKHHQRNAAMPSKNNGKLPMEFLDGLLVLAPNRRDSLLKYLSQINDYSLGTKAKRRKATVVNAAHGNSHTEKFNKI
jgi:hypothetical protein